MNQENQMIEIDVLSLLKNLETEIFNYLNCLIDRYFSSRL